MQRHNAAHPGDDALRQLVVNAEKDFCEKTLAEEWGRAVGLDGPAVAHVEAVNPRNVAGGIHEVLKYATKGEGTGRDQAKRAAAVEYAMANTKRVTILGALRSIKGRSVN